MCLICNERSDDAGSMFGCVRMFSSRPRIVTLLANRRHDRWIAITTQRNQMNSILLRRPGSGPRVAIAGLAGALMITGCASAPPAPTAKLEAAQKAIATAEQAEAGRHAGTELAQARTKLASANAAVQQEEMVAAAQLADQSRAEAELASAKTAAVKAQAVNDDMNQSNVALVDEMQRTTGERK